MHASHETNLAQAVRIFHLITHRSLFLLILQVASGFMAPAPIALRANAARSMQLRRPATGVTALTAKTVGEDTVI